MHEPLSPLAFLRFSDSHALAFSDALRRLFASSALSAVEGAVPGSEPIALSQNSRIPEFHRSTTWVSSLLHFFRGGCSGESAAFTAEKTLGPVSMASMRDWRGITRTPELLIWLGCDVMSPWGSGVRLPSVAGDGCPDSTSRRALRTTAGVRHSQFTFARNRLEPASG